MGELLPDGSIGGYEGFCSKCGEVISTNIQGNEIGKHICNPISKFKVGEFHRQLYNPSNETMIELLRKRIADLEKKHNQLIEYLKEQNESRNKHT